MRLFVLWFLWCLVATPAFAGEQVKVCERSDGSVSIIHFSPGSNLDADWEKTKASNPDLASLPCVDKDVVDLPPARDRRHAWRMVGGNVKVDMTATDPAKVRRNRREEIRRKLKAGEPLTDLEVAELVP